MKKSSRLLFVLAGLTLVFGSFGCAAGKYTGGGFIASAAGGGQKATFGFNLSGVDRDGDGLVDIIWQELDENSLAVWWLAKGQFQYNDHGANVNFHFDCDLTTAWAWNEGEPFPDTVNVEIDWNTGEILRYGWFGTYSSKKGTGYFTLYITSDGDDQGHLIDTIEINVESGPYAGYHNAGPVEGGNIQWHPAK